MSSPTFLLTALSLLLSTVYLFIQAPAPLPDANQATGQLIPIETVFQLVAAENNVVRALWTSEIVGAGKAVGLAFKEEWRENGVAAGPLPALFLREAAAYLESDPVPLSLFLGSDFPINPSNGFTTQQLAMFAQVKTSQAPQFFYAEDTQRYTALFPDIAAVQACVDCHNAHPDSPKQDWALNDVMGATTWAYPKKAVTLEEMLTIIHALRQSFRAVYSSYLDKVATFDKPPVIGEQWPRAGYYLPTADHFMAEFAQRAAPQTTELLLVAGTPTRQNDQP